MIGGGNEELQWSYISTLRAASTWTTKYYIGNVKLNAFNFQGEFCLREFV